MAILDPEQFRRAMEKAPAQLFAALKPALTQHVRGFVQGTVARQLISGRPNLINRTGALRRSFNFTIEGSDLASLTIAEFSTSPYAAIHEFGGTIQAKGKKLAIPLPAARTGGGVSRGGPLQYPDLFPRKSKAGNTILFRPNGKGKAPTPMFVLKQSVQIPARLGFRKTHLQDQEARRAVLAKAAKTALDRLGAA